MPPTQLVHSAPAIACFPAAQIEQSPEELDPVLGVALPATQLVQAVAPASAAYLPARQTAHVDESDEPVVDKYLPTAQEVQLACPVAIA